MNELVFLKNKQALTTSLKVATEFNKRHDRVVRDIRNLIAQIGDVPKIGETPMFLKSTYTHEQNGQIYPMYLMNRDGFTLLAMGFTGEKALKFKLDYIAAFNAMEQTLLNQRNAEWQAIREAGKRGNRSMCDAIHDYIIPLARANGSTTPDNVFYMNYQKAVNKAAGVQANSRDTQPLGQLYEVEKIQEMVGISIRGQAARGEHDYKKIYHDTNQLITDYSRMSLIPQRFLTA